MLSEVFDQAIVSVSDAGMLTRMEPFFPPASSCRLLHTQLNLVELSSAGLHVNSPSQGFANFP